LIGWPTQHVGEFGVDDQEPFCVGLGRGDSSSGMSSPVAGSGVVTSRYWMTDVVIGTARG